MKAVRAVSVCLALVLAVALLAACGGNDGTATPRAGSSSSAPGTATTSAAVEAVPTATGNLLESSGELRIASGFLPATLDPLQDGYSLVTRGMAETLTRITADQRIEPWLAESVEQTDDTTWRVTLRDEATFWDGTAVNATAVKESFERSLAEIPNAPQFIDPATEFNVIDEWTLDLILPEPVPGLLNNLTTFQFVVSKRVGDDYLMTGPYQPVRLIADSELELEAYQAHWGGTPPIARIHIRLATDANARLLALQAGEIDMVTEVPPELAGDLGANVDTVVVSSTRLHHIILNHQRSPFDDVAVRQAFSLGIDRDVLIDVALAGLGTVATSIFPPGLGVATPEVVATDLDRAAQLLDDAGWVVGSDGVRARDGARLALTLYSYPSRPELTPIAVSIQDQLRVLGFDINVQQVESIVPQLETLDFEAGMFSINMLPIGDPRYAFNVTVVEDAIYNYGGYANSELDEIIEVLQVESDAEERERLVLRAQEILAEDAVNVYLIAAPRIAAYRTDRVNPFELHPNDLYGVDRTITLVK